MILGAIIGFIGGLVAGYKFCYWLHKEPIRIGMAEQDNWAARGGPWGD